MPFIDIVFYNTLLHLILGFDAWRRVPRVRSLHSCGPRGSKIPSYREGSKKSNMRRVLGIASLNNEFRWLIYKKKDSANCKAKRICTLIFLRGTYSFSEAGASRVFYIESLYPPV